MEFQPLRIDIKLRSPMVEPKQIFHLDALLSALAVMSAERKHGAVDPADYQHALPLDKYHAPSGHWCFKASAFVLTPISEPYPWFMSSRMDFANVATDRESGLLKLRAAKPNPGGGPFKTSAFNESVLWANLHAWCIGDKQGVSEMLSGCEQVGGRRGTGFGLVSSICVTTVSESECLWFNRVMPGDSPSFTGQASMAKSIGGLRSPYWDRRNHTEVRVPIG